jgi:pilus assembly protein Flp/PilA
MAGAERLAVKRIVNAVARLRQRRDDGASAVEYGLLVALIAVVIAGTVALLGGALNQKMSDACNSVAAGASDCGGGGGGEEPPAE